MKNKLTGLVIAITIAVLFYGCKKDCCTLAQETNVIVALKNNTEWRTEGQLYRYNSRKDTVMLSGSNGEEKLNITIKKSGDNYTMFDVTFYIVQGDIILADYVLDTSKSNAFATTTNTDALLEGNFTLYFKLNHDDTSHSRPKTVAFKSGLFRVGWDHVTQPVLWGVRK